jgi:hypothetical protein
VVTFPTIVTPVRVVGGPAGPAIGPIGPTGPMSSAFVGVIGPTGPSGMQGFMGALGRLGLNSTVTGTTGRVGPSGSSGYPGPRGATGPFEFIPENRFQYYENLVGSSLVTSGGAVGCKFIYAPKREFCILLAMFTGLAEPASSGIFQVGPGSGVGPAPNPGEFGGYGDSVEVSGAGLSIPFFAVHRLDYRDGGEEFPYSDRWYDLTTLGGGGTVRNISCIVLEF